MKKIFFQIQSLKKGLLFKLILIFLTIGVLAFWGNYAFELGYSASLKDQKESTQLWNTIDKQAYYDCCSQYVISKTTIYETIKGYSRELFVNAKNVVDVRLGPDRKTIHFLVNDGMKKEGKCADLKSSIRPDEDLMQRLKKLGKDIPPTSPPWDFQKIGEELTIPKCDNSGFFIIDNEPYFVYLETLYAGGVKSKLSLINNDSKKSHELFVSESDMKGLKTGSAKEIIYDYGVESSELNGTLFYYPDEIFKVANGKIGIRVRGKIFVLDLVNNKMAAIVNLPEINEQLKSGICGQGILSNNNNLLLIEKYFCEGGSLSAVVDLSNDKPKITDLSSYDLSSSYDKSNKTRMDANKITIERPITEKATKDILGFDPNVQQTSCKGNSEKFERDTEEKIKQKLSVEEVHCSICGDYYFHGCSITTGSTTYEYTTQSGFKKVK